MGRERRRSERIESRVSVRYASREGRISGCALTKDLGEGGLGLPVDGKIPQGSALNLTIILDESDQRKIPAIARVVWSRKNFEHWKSKYSSGLRFVNIDHGDKKTLMDYVKRHRWVKSDFERALEEDKVPVLGGRGDF